MEKNGSIKVSKGYKKRSRNGCTSCKKSKVKCDEKHPSCSRCERRGTYCSYPLPISFEKVKSKKKELNWEQLSEKNGSVNNVSDFQFIAYEKGSNANKNGEFSLTGNISQKNDEEIRPEERILVEKEQVKEIAKIITDHNNNHKSIDEKNDVENNSNTNGEAIRSNIFEIQSEDLIIDPTLTEMSEKLNNPILHSIPKYSDAEKKNVEDAIELQNKKKAADILRQLINEPTQGKVDVDFSKVVKIKPTAKDE